MIQKLKEADILELHQFDARRLPPYINNCAFEMITHGGKHIKTYNLPKLVNDKSLLEKVPFLIDDGLLFGQLPHMDTFYEILKRIFNLDFEGDFIDIEIQNYLASNGVYVDPDNYSSPEICIVHYNQVISNRIQNVIAATIPAFVTKAQCDKLNEISKYYRENLIGRVSNLDFEIYISSWNPINNSNSEEEYSPKSFEEACGLLVSNNRVVDYKLPLEEHEFCYDYSLEDSKKRL